MSEDHTMLDVTEAPHSRSSEDYLNGDALIAWLKLRQAEVDRLLSDPIVVQSISTEIELENEQHSLTDCLRTLDSLARELSRKSLARDTLSSLRTASLALIRIFDLLAGPTAALPNRPAWIEVVVRRGGGITGVPGLGTEISMAGCLNDIFTRVAALDEPSAGARPITTPRALFRQDFGRQFIGTGADDLRAHIRHLNEKKSKTFYANVVPVLQSSGAGKTRTVVQLTGKELGLLICVRREREGPLAMVSEPPRDQDAARWLKTQSRDPKQSSVFVENRALAIWLIAMAESIHNVYCDQWARYIKLAGGEDWPEFVEQVGQLLAPSSAVISSPSPRRDLTKVDEQQLAERARLLSAIHQRAEELIPQFPETAYLASRDLNIIEEETRCVRFFQKRLEQAFEPLSKFVASHGGEDAFFHFAIDECGSLGYSLSKLRRLWQVLPLNCWMLWIDSNTEISLTYGSETRASSMRLATHELQLMRPFVALPQDIELMHKITEFRNIVFGRTSVTFSSTLNWLPRMGRPLLSDQHVLQSTDVADCDSKMVLNNLAYKISLNRNPFNDCRSAIALIAQRFPINLVGLTGVDDPRTFAEKLVESHMRRLVSVSEAGDVIETSGPSEPLLSLASAHVFCDARPRAPQQAWSDAIRHIKMARAEYGLEIGEAGEEIVRLLVSAAMDLCWHAHQTFPFLRLVNLRDFLRKLFLQGKEEPEEFQPVLTWATEYWLNFTHVIASAESFHADAPLLRAGVSEAWLRQGAILGPKNQAGWDLLLPIYRCATQPKMTDNFDSKALSFIPIQTKNVANGNKAGWDTDFSASSVKLDGNPNGVPCTIWFDLRRKSQMVHVKTATALRRSQRLTSTLSTAHSEPHAYHILARGHDALAINILSIIEGRDIPTLLGAVSDDDDSFLDDRMLLLNQGKMTWIQNETETPAEDEETDVAMP